MPSVSGSQQRYMGAAYARAKAGRSRSTDPKMSLNQLRDFSRKARPTVPERSSYGSAPVKEST